MIVFKIYRYRPEIIVLNVPGDMLPETLGGDAEIFHSWEEACSALHERAKSAVFEAWKSVRACEQDLASIESMLRLRVAPGTTSESDAREGLCCD